MGIFGFTGPELTRDFDSLAAYANRSAGLEPPPATGGLGARAPRSGHCAAPEVYTDAGITVGLQGQPRWPDEPPAHPATARSIHAAWRESNEGLLNRLQGSFALAILDERSGRVLLAIDRMGIERLTWRVVGTGLVFGTSAESVANLPGHATDLSQQALFDFLLLHMVPSPGTVFRNVHKLPPACFALFENGRVRVSRYWNPTFIDRGRANFDELKHGLHDALDFGVRDAGIDERTGAFLSGGLDSSTVTGVLGKVTQRPPRSFSIGFGVDAYDELQYARISSRHFKCDATEYHVTPDDVVTAFPLIANAYDEPFGNSSAVPTYFCARLAVQSGITHLLAGDGGDELFGGNERYAKQRIFEAYFKLPGFVRSALIEPIARQIPPEGAPLPLHKLRSYVDQALVPLPERLESWNFMYRTDLGQMLDRDFLAAIDTRAPLRLLDEVYREAPSSSVLNKLLYYDWHFTLADDDLRKVGTMCRLAGVRVSFPMLHQKVVDLSLKVPASMKMRGLELRSFYKRAMRGFLAPETLAKQKHGFGLPFGQWLKTHAGLRDLIYTQLSDLKSRGIIRPGFLDELIEQHRQGHPTYFGYAIWDLAMLEAWLKAHTRAAVTRAAVVA